MSRFRQRKERELGVDISPLIDMVFILLIFFAVNSTFVKITGVEVDQPVAKSATLQPALVLPSTPHQHEAYSPPRVAVRPLQVVLPVLEEDGAANSLTRALEI